jgi:hypothetical protein
MRSDALTIRAATSSDTGAIRRLAASTSRPRPRGPLLVAEHDGEMLAAIAVSSGAVITDPGSPVADIVRGLRRRRYQLLRQNGDAGAARALRRTQAPAARLAA